MIRVTIELIPLGLGKPKIIGRMFIWNKGHRGGSTTTLSNYGVGVCRRGKHAADPPVYTRTGEVNNYKREAYNVWRLIIRSLLSAFPEERKT